MWRKIICCKYRIEESAWFPIVEGVRQILSYGRKDITNIGGRIMATIFMNNVDIVLGDEGWSSSGKIDGYRAAVRTQSLKVEMIECLYKPLDDDGIMRELLVDFYQTNNGRKPAQIIIFRDGVSESQSNQVLNIELDQMLKHLGEATVPKFTVIVAQKNHQQSYFNQVSKCSEDKKVVESKGIGRKLLTNFTKHIPLNLVRRSCL
ncbi:hypothetical protein RHMOL_Rhmol02G0034800 [Rhododendron molle]|uniref:Uncharacterized protein n=2 Tax=Rhododendron molle TaxID=49168 RepID=A0ACC0PKW6_RHOML|nr:hypothetical protein RHMOL_Rhmol02G0034800 [Rhododendron molle]KAI8566359.1 hypothetical protein RHMOL_Rhmol02G0034800 [Rhododendron molle]